MKLNELKCFIDETCTKIGFEKEIQKFTPHLTLARISYKTSLSKLSLLSEYNSLVEPISITVDNLSLMKSVFTNHGIKYIRLANFQIC